MNLRIYFLSKLTKLNKKEENYVIKQMLKTQNKVEFLEKFKLSAITDNMLEIADMSTNDPVYKFDLKKLKDDVENYRVNYNINNKFNSTKNLSTEDYDKEDY